MRNLDRLQSLYKTSARYLIAVDLQNVRASKDFFDYVAMGGHFRNSYDYIEACKLSR